MLAAPALYGSDAHTEKISKIGVGCTKSAQLSCLFIKFRLVLGWASPNVWLFGHFESFLKYPKGDKLAVTFLHVLRVLTSNEATEIRNGTDDVWH